MENNDNMILTDQSIGKEYQIPELVDLNSVSETMGGAPCINGSGAGICVTGAAGGAPDV